MVGVAVRAHNIVELFYAEILYVFNHRVSGRGCARVDEHVPTAAADKLRVALADIDIMDIQPVHRHGDRGCIFRYALEYKQRRRDNDNDKRREGIFFCKSGELINITFFNFPAHSSLQ